MHNQMHNRIDGTHVPLARTFEATPAFLTCLFTVELGA